MRDKGWQTSEALVFSIFMLLQNKYWPRRSTSIDRCVYWHSNILTFRVAGSSAPRLWQLMGRESDETNKSGEHSNGIQ